MSTGSPKSSRPWIILGLVLLAIPAVLIAVVAICLSSVGGGPAQQ